MRCSVLKCQFVNDNEDDNEEHGQNDEHDDHDKFIDDDYDDDVGISYKDQLVQRMITCKSIKIKWDFLCNICDWLKLT